MRRFTVSLPDDLYTSLRRRGQESAPPATLQQMVRYAVETMLHQPPATAPETITGPDPEESPAPSLESVDLLVFAIREVPYGIPIELVETVAARLDIHPVPTASSSLLGVAEFRRTLTEVHDGGLVLQHEPLGTKDAATLLAITGSTGRVLLTVSSVAGLTPASDLQWADRPRSAPTWVAGLAWTDQAVIAIVDPPALNL
jgi:chemotaxis signal transduction protein